MPTKFHEPESLLVGHLLMIKEITKFYFTFPAKIVFNVCNEREVSLFLFCFTFITYNSPLAVLPTFILTVSTSFNPHSVLAIQISNIISESQFALNYMIYSRANENLKRPFMEVWNSWTSNIVYKQWITTVSFNKFNGNKFFTK